MMGCSLRDDRREANIQFSFQAELFLIREALDPSLLLYHTSFRNPITLFKASVPHLFPWRKLLASPCMGNEQGTSGYWDLNFTPRQPAYNTYKHEWKQKYLVFKRHSLGFFFMIHISVYYLIDCIFMGYFGWDLPRFRPTGFLCIGVGGSVISI